MMKKFLRHLKQAERGQSIIILGIAFIVLLGFVGLTTDVSLMFVRYATIRRAVDSASLAAATQMRQGTEEATVAIAAKQFVEFHGLNSVDVLVESCQTLDRQANESDFADPADWEKLKELEEELCTDDQRKLVKVIVQAESPTVFLRLLGWETFTLQASAISETAALDVVLIMDVSESMLSETSYDDWAKIGMGYAFRPPHVDVDIARAKAIADLSSPSDFEISQYTSNYWETSLLAWQTISGTGGQPSVNNRLWYNYDTNNDGTVDSPFVPPFETANDPTVAPNDPLYEVQVYDLDQLAAYDHTVHPEFPADVTNPSLLPRDACRVRFYPSSTLVKPSAKNARLLRPGEGEGQDPNFQLLNEFYASNDVNALTPNFKDLDGDGLIDSDAWDYSAFGYGSGSNRDNSSWNGFVPTYDFYGCCNDPGTHVLSGDGGPVYDANSGYVTLSNGSADFDFTDLICQPFKGARDAVELFLERIDFIRGDRVAFVTFDRSAFLINPWNTDGQLAGGSHMIDRYDHALLTLRKVIGVRAEPNFYLWDDGNNSGGGAINAQWVAFASEGQPIDYESVQGNGVYFNDSSRTFGAPNESIYYHSYPVRDFCFYGDASTADTYSLSDGAFGAAHTLPYPRNERQDGTQVSNLWNSYVLGQVGGGGLRYDNSALEDWFMPRLGYEFWSQCRGTNIGAALREGNNALVDPNTTRRFGAIWVMVLLGDGAAGASDPVRRNGNKLSAPEPYRTDAFGNFDPVGGDYGAFGVCPFGVPSDPGELIDDIPEMSQFPLGFEFPYCSDEDPQTRHDCDFRPDDGAEAIQDNDYKTYDQLVADGDYIEGDPTETRTQSQIELDLNRSNLYDLDIGDGCGNQYYDVDDYARDWADYVSLRDPDSPTDELLPTIYTIGFGLNFDGSENPVASSSVEDYLGEQLLRYIADVGDNNELDNDYYEHYHEYLNNPNELHVGEFGFRGPCQTVNLGTSVQSYDLNNDTTIDAGEFDLMFEPLPPKEDCGNYFNAPSANELEAVFDSIASKLFTRLAG